MWNWFNAHNYHCHNCGCGFNDPEETRHENFCSEACFQLFWDWQDSLIPSSIPATDAAETVSDSTSQQSIYDSRANIATILTTIENAAYLSSERISYAQKLFICLANEDRALLQNEALRNTVVQKMEEFNALFQTTPTLPLRQEVFTAMNRCREVIDEIAGIARA